MTKAQTVHGTFSADALMDALRNADMNAADLAEELGCTVETTAMWIAGVQKPRLTSIRAMARILEVEPDDLMEEE